MQGQSGEVTCECEGATVCKLKWEKQEDDGESYAAVPESRVTVNRNLSANRVQAILNITNAQPEDSGTYKCNVSVEPNKSDFKLIVIRVKGKLSLIKPFSLRSRRLKVYILQERMGRATETREGSDVSLSRTSCRSFSHITSKRLLRRPKSVKCSLVNFQNLQHIFKRSERLFLVTMYCCS